MINNVTMCRVIISNSMTIADRIIGPMHCLDTSLLTWENNKHIRLLELTAKTHSYNECLVITKNKKQYICMEVQTCAELGR